MADTVWLVRHGKREDSDPAWIKSAPRPLDPGLNALGIEQARLAGERLKGQGIEHVFCSPFLRTVETAHIIADTIGAPLKIEQGLCEWLNPEWFETAPESLSTDVLTRRFSRIEADYRSVGAAQYPEDVYQALRRAAATAQLLAEAYPQPLLLVGHGASVAGAIFGLVPKAGDIHCSLCGIYKLAKQGDEWSLQLRNDLEHLRPLKQTES